MSPISWTDPRTWLAGEVPSAATLNTHIRDNFDAIGDAWTAYTPAWTAATTNPVIGNGTITAAWMQAGKFIAFRIVILAGTTTTFGSGAYSFTYPPFTPADTSNPGNPGLTGFFYDFSALKPYGCFALGNTSTTFRPLMASTDSFMSHLVPIAPGTSDEWNFGGIYQAA